MSPDKSYSFVIELWQPQPTMPKKSEAQRELKRKKNVVPGRTEYRERNSPKGRQWSPRKDKGNRHGTIETGAVCRAV